jgi:hypothetical protein
MDAGARRQRATSSDFEPIRDRSQPTRLRATGTA